MSVNVSIKVSVNVSHMVTSALACHKASVHYQIANSTFFTKNALVLKFSAFFAFVGVILPIPSLYLFRFSKTYDNFSEFQYHLIDIWPHVIGSVVIPPYIYVQNKSLRRFIFIKYRDVFYNML